MKKVAALVLILLCLMTLCVVYFRPIKAQYQGDITINADGSVNPSTAPIQQTGTVYTLTSNVDGAIYVDRNNTILDGNECTIAGGILLNEASNITVKSFVITDGEQFQSNIVDGILLNNASGVAVANNTISGVWSIWVLNGVGYVGIDIEGGGSNVISGNDFAGNGVDIDFSQTQNNLIVGNNITSGMSFSASSNNTIYHNNFFHTLGYSDSSSINVWDDGFPWGGNYWADYLSRYPNATEIGSSGIGNTAYVMISWFYQLESQDTDRYPLMKPFNSTFYAMQTTLPEISLLSPLNQTYDNSSVPLAFSVNVLSPVKSVNWTGYSLDGQQNVTITGNTTLTGLSSGLHNITVYANDTYGNMGTSKTISFIIAKPFPTATVAAVSVAVMVALAAGLLVYFKKRKGDRKS